MKKKLKTCIKPLCTHNFFCLLLLPITEAIIETGLLCNSVGIFRSFLLCNSPWDFAIQNPTNFKHAQPQLTNKLCSKSRFSSCFLGSQNSVLYKNLGEKIHGTRRAKLAENSTVAIWNKSDKQTNKQTCVLKQIIITHLLA